MVENILDISRWQGNMQPAKTIAAGCPAIYFRGGGYSSHGTAFTDSQFSNNVRKFNGRIPWGMYYLFQSHIEPYRQAKQFEELKDVAMEAGGAWHLPPMMDVETNPSQVEASVFAQRLKNTIKQIEEANDIPGEIGIYTRGYFWNDNVYTHLMDMTFFRDRPLWIARYTSQPQPWGNPHDSDKLQPKPWQNWWLWQWSADGNGRGAEFGAESHSIDINRANFTSTAAFYEHIGWTQPEPPAPPASNSFQVFGEWTSEYDDELNLTTISEVDDV